MKLPVGLECLEINAHGVFDPRSMERLALASRLLLEEFAWIGVRCTLVQSSNPEKDMEKLSKLRYDSGVFPFIKQ